MSDIPRNPESSFELGHAYPTAKRMLLAAVRRAMDTTGLSDDQQCLLRDATEHHVFLRAAEPTVEIPHPPIQMRIRGIMQEKKGDMELLMLEPDAVFGDSLFDGDLVKKGRFFDRSAWKKLKQLRGKAMQEEIEMPHEEMMRSFFSLEPLDKEAIADVLVAIPHNALEAVLDMEGWGLQTRVGMQVRLKMLREHYEWLLNG